MDLSIRVPLCDLDQVLLKEVMAENRGLTFSDLKNRSPEHLSATLTGCESPDGNLEPAAVKEVADDQLSEIASTIPPVDPSCVDLKHSAFLVQLLLDEVDLESTSEPASPVGKPVLHMQPIHTGEPVARIADALARPASNNMPLSEHDTQELRRLLYLKAEGIERQERLQYLRQTWKSSIWSEEDDDSYTLRDREIPLVYSLYYGQQCPPEWDDGSVPAETADRQKKKKHGKSNLHAEEDFLQKLESLNLDPRLKKLLMTYEEVLTRSRGGPATGRCGGHAQVSRQAKHYAHRGINALMSCDKAFQNPCHSEMRERKYVQQHIRICTHGVKTGLG